MATPVYGLTFGVIKERILRAVDDLVEAGTATSGSTTAIVDTGRFIDATDTRLKGVHWYIRNGTGQAQEGRGTAFTPGSDTITIPTQGTAISSTSEYLLSRRFSQSDVLTAMRTALTSLGRHAVSYIDQSLIMGSPLNNATAWDNSGTFPNGWTAGGSGGSWSRESAITKHGRFAFKAVGDGTNATSQTQTINNIGRWFDKQLQLKAWVHAVNASRVYISITDTGYTTATETGGVTGWQELDTDAFNFNSKATSITVTMGITAGSGVPAYFSGLHVTGVDWKEWDMPAGNPTSIHRVQLEGSVENEWGSYLSNDALEVLPVTGNVGSYPRIRIATPYRAIPTGRIIGIHGRTSWADHATAASDDDTTFDGPGEWRVAQAAYFLLLQRPRSEDKDLLGAVQLNADRLRPLQAALPSGSAIVERG